MTIIHIRGQKPLEMPFVEDDDVIQKLSAKASDHAFNTGVLPGRSRRRDDFVFYSMYIERLKPSLNPITKNTIAVSSQIPERRIERKRSHNLLVRPWCRRVLRNVQADHAPARGTRKAH